MISEIQTPQLSINDSLGIDLVSEICSFVEFRDLHTVMQTCQSWKKIALESFWNKVLTCSESLVDNRKEITAAAIRIGRLFQSNNEADQLELCEIMNKCGSMKIKTQITFIRNLYIHTDQIEKKQKDSKTLSVSSLFVNFFNHPKAPTACKLKSLSYINSLKIDVLDQLNWNEHKVVKGCMPKNYKPFKEFEVPTNFVSQLEVHPNNSFEPGELVAVIESHGHTIGDSALFFGKIVEKSGERWKIHLELRDTHKWAIITSKFSNEIGKLPHDCELPAFCNS